MNGMKLSEMLNGLPDDMILAAYTGSYRTAQTESAADFAAGQTVQQGSTAGISAPRWITAAALAACMLFAVGVAAVLIRSDREELTMQSMQEDSAVQVVTAAYTVTYSAAQSVITQTSYTAAVIVTEDTQTETAAEMQTTESEQTAQEETTASTAGTKTTMPESTTVTQIETSMLPAEKYSSKVMNDVVNAIEAGETRIPVQLTFKRVDVEAQARKAAQEYEQTLDPAFYSPDEINQMTGDYYIRIHNELYVQAIKERSAEIMEKLSIDSDSAVCYSESEKISCTLTPEQIAAADQYDMITRIAKGYVWSYTEEN